MPITPEEAAKYLDTKIEDQVKEECIAIDAYLIENWHTGKSCTTVPASTMGPKALEQIICAYDAVGWDVTYHTNEEDGGCWFQFFKKAR